ncbi:tetratricopeptide repeat protein [Mucilaginibacter sp. ZT4R22]|uniref:Tetratricopeptide repeat protein n=1 Tax=Mucilaginibacter pankratovii TaxID=2772110 RepID=A0ABR7WYV7_9SPHI|nr:tetratricopeptide repeat protein [Mucilaginibacter pankratovii]MBD1367464.1 tetratricopeptide repeat protein [Mucilaginibacter pankratovii]
MEGLTLLKSKNHIPYFEHFVGRLTSEEQNTVQIALIFNVIGVDYFKNNDLTKAKSFLGKAYEIIIPFRDNKDQFAISSAATVIGNIGVIEMKLNNLEDALGFLELAAKTDYGMYKDGLKSAEDTAHSLTNLGDYWLEYHDLYNAGEFYDQALLLWDLAIEKAPTAAIKLRKARLLNKFAQIHFMRSQYIIAERYCKEAVDIIKEYESPTVEVLEPLVEIYLTLGQVLQKARAKNEAERIYKHGITLAEALAKESENAFGPVLTNLLCHFGACKREFGELDEAEEILLSGLDRYRKHSELLPEKYQVNIAKAYMDLGVIYAEQRKYDLSEVSYNESLSIKEKLALKNPSFESSKLSVYNNRAGLYRSMGNLERALEDFKKALAIAEGGLDDEKLAVSSLRANILTNIAYVQHDLDDPEFEKSIDLAITIYRNIVTKDKDFYKLPFADVLVKKGKMLGDRGSLKDALIPLNEAIEIQTALLSDDNDIWLSASDTLTMLIACHLDLDNVRLAGGMIHMNLLTLRRYDKSKKHFQKALQWTYDLFRSRNYDFMIFLNDVELSYKELYKEDFFVKKAN